MIKNILYIGAFEMPDKNAAAHRVLNNAKSYRQFGIKTIFIDMQKEPYLNDYEIISELIEVYHRMYPKSFFSYLNYAISLKKFKEVIKQHREIDTVIVYNIFSLVFFRIFIYCKLHNIKIISDCSEWYSASKFNFIKKIDIFLRMRVLNKLCDGIIVISNFLETYYSNQHTVKIPPLIDINDAKWDIQYTVKKNDEIIFSYCGFPEKKERLDLFINVLSSTDFNSFSYKFLIAGISEYEFCKRNPNVNKEMFNKKIFFQGKIPHKQALQLMRDSDYGVLIRENNRTNNAGFPTKFVEYKSLGVSIIGNTFSDIRNYSTKNDIFFDDLNYENVHKALNLAFKRNKDKCKPLTYFDYHNFSEKFNDFFKII